MSSFLGNSSFHLLSVGQASALLAVVVIAVAYVARNLTALVLSAFLGDVNNAVTWSVAGRVLQQSLWPTVMQTDVASTHRVRRSILLLSWATNILVTLIGVAGVITPLGLYSTLEGQGKSDTRFRYVPDDSSIGMVTKRYILQTPSRVCQRIDQLHNFGAVPCPGTNQTDIEGNVVDRTEECTDDAICDTAVPNSLVDLFSSGFKSQARTVSTPFDLRWRHQAPLVQRLSYMNNGSGYSVNAFYPVQSRILNKGWDALEGVMADHTNGGIAFRNHTVPVGHGAGWQWHEDLLHLKPETVCVNLNISLDWDTIPIHGPKSNVANMRLTDRGGLSNADSLPDWDFDEGENEVDLYARALKGALYHNHFLRQDFKFIPKNGSFGLNNIAPTLWSVNTVNIDQQYVVLEDFLMQRDPLSHTEGAAYNSYFRTGPVFANAMKIAQACVGARVGTNSGLRNINNVAVGCGLVMGNSQSPLGITEANRRETAPWTMPMYSCATAVKASVRKFTFKVGTAEASSTAQIQVVDDRPLEYNSDHPPPIWGVERIENNTWTLPLWGMVEASRVNESNVDVIQRDHLYLPGRRQIEPIGIFDSIIGEYLDNFPAPELAQFSVAGVNLMYEYMNDPFWKPYLNGAVNPWMGAGSDALHLEWQQLLKDDSTAHIVLEKIWTDMMSNAIYSGRGVLGAGNAEGTLMWPAESIQRQVKLHWLYAIPAFVTLGALVTMGLAGVFVVVTRRATVSRMKRGLFQTAPGRLLTSTADLEGACLQSRTKDWVRHGGVVEFDLSGRVPRRLMNMSDYREIGTGTTITTTETKSSDEHLEKHIRELVWPLKSDEIKSVH